MKRAIAMSLGLGLGLMATTAIAETKNPGTFVFLWTDDVQSFDPAYIADTPSSYGVLNVYSRLLNYKGSEISEFVPSLSTEVPSLENGLIVEHDDGSVSYTFPIREGVFAHRVGIKGDDGSISWELYDTLTDEQKAAMVPGYGEITAEDVQYSLLRAMLMGQSWMSNAITEVVTAGKYPTIADWVKDVGEVDSIDDASPEALRQVYDALASQIVVDGDKVTITLPSSFPATLGVMALPFGTSIVDKEWTADVGGWTGSGDDWREFYRPELSADALFDKENGTGPFMLEEWDKTDRRITLKRFDNYFMGPASLERVVIRTVPEWTTRRLQLLSGDADFVAAPVEFLDELSKTEGVKVIDSLPKVFSRGLFFFWPIDDNDNPAIGSGKLDGKGIPPEFFGDIDVRKGFNYAQNYDVLIQQVLLGKTVQSRGPSVRGIMGYRPDSPVYTYDLDKAAEHFKKAFDGKLWDVGFEFTAYIQEGNTTANAAMSILQQGLQRVNPKFKMKIQALPSASLQALRNNREKPAVPFTFMGWGPDYSDPGGPLGAATYYLASTGLVGGFSGQGYRDLMAEHFDPLLAEAWASSDPAVREPIYAKLQEMSYDYATTQFLFEEFGYIVVRDNIDGYVHNMITYGAWDFYPITKGD
ncbi:ABC transporter substrate-binding protein [Frigidibacter sp. ROC022]|uniref:ABC transporter substrate-binding protein n=1 Tax=Frigidibacter sp. ROC022 TaxID=2971796 RepID=UPI00215AC8BD|nr:ABC transporter substrate-binding protein [Frigidibacter sp. ROC022]MCR8725740.1 ABC transporter substrate-binding protein [Frigidibacter sp. ROC022]